MTKNAAAEPQSREKTAQGRPKIRKDAAKAAPGTSPEPNTEPQAPPRVSPGVECSGKGEPYWDLVKPHFLTKSDPFTVVKPHFAKWHVFEGPEPVTKVTCEVADASVSNSYFTAKVCSNGDIVRRLHKGDCTNVTRHACTAVLAQRGGSRRASPRPPRSEF